MYEGFVRQTEQHLDKWGVEERFDDGGIDRVSED